MALTEQKNAILNFESFFSVTIYFFSSLPLLKFSSLLPFVKFLKGYKAFMNERRPTNFDKKVLVWAGRFKKEEDIPKYIT